MDSDPTQTLMDCPTTPAHKPSFIVRCYRHSDDLDRIRDIFVGGTLNGPDAPYNVVTSHFAPRIVRAYIACAAGFVSLCALSAKPIYVPKFMGLVGEPPFPTWVAGAVSAASALAAAYFWRSQRKFHNMFRVCIRDALAEDFADIPAMFGLGSREGSLECFPTGARGFWVAEEGDTIVGFVGLNMGASTEEKIGEVCRMVVSPSHRRRGVGKELMAAVDRHAKANGIVALELTTSHFNVGALKMYKKYGWRPKRPRMYNGVLLDILRKDL